VRLKSLPDRESALDWIDRNQLGRRNLSPRDFTLLIGRIYERTKKAQGAPIGNSNASKQTGQNGPFVSTAKTLAKQHNVSENTVKRAGQYANAVGMILEIAPEFDHSKVKSKKVTEIAETVKKNDKEKAIEMIKECMKSKPKKTGKGGRKPLIDMNAGNQMDAMSTVNHQMATIAISQLERIRIDDEYSLEAVLRVKKHINEMLKSIKEYQNKTRKATNE